jgi:CDGSH iron-sulfur domain-containing protein 3
LETIVVRNTRRKFDMADVTIKVMDDGPLFVSGNVDVVDAEGNRFETKQQVALCRCG